MEGEKQRALYGSYEPRNTVMSTLQGMWKYSPRIFVFKDPKSQFENHLFRVHRPLSNVTINHCLNLNLPILEIVIGDREILYQVTFKGKEMKCKFVLHFLTSASDI